MAYHPSIAMQTEADIAMRTFDNLSARAALQGRGPGSSRAQYHNLFPAFQCPLDVRDEFYREIPAHSVFSSFCLSVDDFDIRITATVEFLLQFYQMMFAETAIVYFFQ